MPYAEPDREHYFLARVTSDLDEPDVTKIYMLDRLDRTTWDQIDEAMNVIHALHRGINTHLRISLDDFEEEVRNAKQALLLGPNLDETSKLRLVNRALNVSVAVRMYEEHVMSMLNRAWDKNSSEISAARTMFSIVFDELFSYRVLYALRNALLHSNRELVTLNLSVRLVDPEAEGSAAESEVIVGLSRAAFAASDARAATRHEVESLENDPDLLELSREVLVRIERLGQALEPLLYPSIEDAVLCVWEAAKSRFPTAEATPCFVTVDSETHLKSILSIDAVIWDYIIRRGQYVAESRLMAMGDQPAGAEDTS